MNEVIRIAMWSGPRNISTAMMRSFGARPDAQVIDEPFYAVFLTATGIDHPMREESIRSQSTDWREVVRGLLGPLSNGKTLFYQKHMTHHMVPQIELDWMAQCRNAFLIRDPVAVLTSYAKKREGATLADIGVVRQWELFEREANRLGHAPPVVDGAAILENPSAMLSRLCAALAIPYTDTMLSWPPGRRDTDGVWAPVWYQAVEQSTGFTRPGNADSIALPDALQRIAEQARPYYEKLRGYCL